MRISRAIGNEFIKLVSFKVISKLISRSNQKHRLTVYFYRSNTCL